MLSIQAKKGNTLNPMPRAIRYNGFCTLNPTYALELSFVEEPTETAAAQEAPA